MFSTYRGLNLHPIWRLDPDIDKLVTLLADARCQAVRIDFPLNFVFTGRTPATSSSPEPFTMHPWYLERITRFLAELPSDIDVLGVTGYAPSFANTPPGMAPQPYNVPWIDPQDFHNAIGQLLRTYPRVSEWELWNEPDLACFWSAPSGSTVQSRAQAYVALMRAGAAAVRSTNPDARLVGPAVSGVYAGGWLDAFYAAGGRGIFDVLSAHVYGDQPWHGRVGETPKQMLRQWLSNVWPVIAENGDAKTELWITECGWTTGQVTDSAGVVHAGVSVDQLADNITATFSALDSEVPTVERLYWYAFDDSSHDGNLDRSYGLVTDTLGVKGDGSALAAFRALP